VRDSLNPSLEIGGVALTMFDSRTRLAEQVVAEVRNHFGDLVFETLVPRSVRLSEAPGFGKPIVRYDGGAKSAHAYRALADEAITRFDLAPRHEAPEAPEITETEELADDDEDEPVAAPDAAAEGGA
jgi:chromosome partitioning protein